MSKETKSTNIPASEPAVTTCGFRKLAHAERYLWSLSDHGEITREDLFGALQILAVCRQSDALPIDSSQEESNG